MYERPRSFIDRLPWTEYLADARAFLLDDGRSVGALYELTPKGTEGRSTAYLAAFRDTVQSALSHVLEEHDEGPWILQFYCYDEPISRTTSSSSSAMSGPRCAVRSTRTRS